MNNVFGIISIILQVLQIVEYLVRIIVLFRPADNETTA